MDLRKLARGLSIAGAVGSLLTVAAAIIRAVEPKANDMPEAYREQIKCLVSDTMKEGKK